MKLSEIIKTEKFKKLFGVQDDIVIKMANIDDVFIILRQLNIMEVSVDLEIMLMVSSFVGSNTGQTLYGSEAIRTGKVSEFFGVKLTLEL